MAGALGGLGALVVHQFAYLLAFPAVSSRTEALADHGHLNLLWALITPAAVAAAVGFVVVQARRLGLGTPRSTRRLGWWTGGIFLVQEVTEGIVGGQSLADLSSKPAILLGLVLAPVVAWVLRRVLNEASELVARFLAIPSVDLRPLTQAFAPSGPDVIRLGSERACLSLRGPPV